MSDHLDTRVSVKMDAARLAGAIGRWLATELVVVDVGARWGAHERWSAYRPHVRVIGFDPDEDECRRLNALRSDDSVVYVPVALGATAGTVVLHETVEPACSSVFPPRVELTTSRPDLALMAPVGSSEVTMATLDDWLADNEVDRVDVMKLDTQGSELDILRGGPRALERARVLEVEVELNPLYEGQPLFGDVDRFLRTQGFVLWRLQHLVHYGLTGPRASAVEVPDVQYFDSEMIPIAVHGGQLFWAHAYFVRREMAHPGPEDEAPSWPVAVRDAAALTAFGFTDLAHWLLTDAARADPSAPGDASADLDAMVG